MGPGLFYRPIAEQPLFINRDDSAKTGKLSSEFGPGLGFCPAGRSGCGGDMGLAKKKGYMLNGYDPTCFPKP